MVITLIQISAQNVIILAIPATLVIHAAHVLLHSVHYVLQTADYRIVQMSPVQIALMATISTREVIVTGVVTLIVSVLHLTTVRNVYLANTDPFVNTLVLMSASIKDVIKKAIVNMDV